MGNHNGSCRIAERVAKVADIGGRGSNTCCGIRCYSTMFAGHETCALPADTCWATISVLKALGDDTSPAHGETWASPNL